jgi:hypothetical protein
VSIRGTLFTKMNLGVRRKIDGISKLQSEMGPIDDDTRDDVLADASGDVRGVAGYFCIQTETQP